MNQMPMRRPQMPQPGMQQGAAPMGATPHLDRFTAQQGMQQQVHPVQGMSPMPQQQAPMMQQAPMPQVHPGGGMGQGQMPGGMPNLQRFQLQQQRAYAR